MLAITFCVTSGTAHFHSVESPFVNPASLFTIIDYAGVAAGALGGALIALRDERYNYDFIGVIGLGLISGVGGGAARDVLLQHGPPLVLTDLRYFYIALGGAVAGLLFGASVGRRTERAITVIDAAGLGFFAVAGATRAAHAGLSMIPALLLGIVTAVGGGSLRDVFMGRPPRIFEQGEPYAMVAALAATLFLLATRSGVPAVTATALAVLVGFTVRLLALRFHWKTRGVRVN
jgi:uncharacterized membrane protein YeiH